MSYAILIEDITSKFYGDEETWENLTWDVISSDDEVLRALYEDAGYDDVFYDQLDNEEKIGHIQGSDAFHELQEEYSPMMNYVHVLQSKPVREDVLKVYKNALNMVILKDDMDNYFIGMSGAGMDFSEELAYAYMVIDRCVPPGFSIDEDSNYSLKKEAHKELVEFLSKNGG